MSSTDFCVYNMPAMLARVVQRENPEKPGHLIRDDAWYEHTRQVYFNLFLFLQSNALVQRQLVADVSSVDSVTISMSDLTELGHAFVKSRADERWLMSFDRAGTKKAPSNVDYLAKHLARLKGH